MEHFAKNQLKPIITHFPDAKKKEYVEFLYIKIRYVNFTQLA